MLAQGRPPKISKGGGTKIVVLDQVRVRYSSAWLMCSSCSRDLLFMSIQPRKEMPLPLRQVSSQFVSA